MIPRDATISVDGHTDIEIQESIMSYLEQNYRRCDLRLEAGTILTALPVAGGTAMVIPLTPGDRYAGVLVV